MVTKGYGLTVNDIDQSCPADLEAYEKAHSKELEEQDYMQHMWWGNYGISALHFALEHCIGGEKSKSKYIKSPILSKEVQKTNGYKESKEEVAIFEMKQRIELLRKQGLPESPI